MRACDPLNFLNFLLNKHDYLAKNVGEIAVIILLFFDWKFLVKFASKSSRFVSPKSLIKFVSPSMRFSCENEQISRRDYPGLFRFFLGG